ncbi:MAG: hypothetical protein JRJ85_26075, partial [Deltaproteobacteria bacterium]|nr:hypothetical protein [Deltaproteobacteria bacterium]
MKKSVQFGFICSVTVFFIVMFFSQSSAWQWPKDLTVGTQGLGTASYAQTVAWG